MAGLAVFERIAALLGSLVRSEEGLRVWMNAANPQLGDYTPLAILREGHGATLVTLLENTLVGQPS